MAKISFRMLVLVGLLVVLSQYVLAVAGDASVIPAAVSQQTGDVSLTLSGQPLAAGATSITVSLTYDPKLFSVKSGSLSTGLSAKGWSTGTPKVSTLQSGKEKWAVLITAPNAAGALGVDKVDLINAVVSIKSGAIGVGTVDLKLAGKDANAIEAFSTLASTSTVTFEAAKVVCGNGQCEAGEDSTTCEKDCPKKCVPKTSCASAKCGTESDGCGGNVNCGTCVNAQTCTNGACVGNAPSPPGGTTEDNEVCKIVKEKSAKSGWDGKYISKLAKALQGYLG